MYTELRYEQVADSLRAAIRDGVFTPGSRLPSLRRACRQYGVSLSTTEQAYRQLEAEGLVRAHARSGYFVCEREDAHNLEPQATSPQGANEAVSVSALTMEMIAASRMPGRINLGATLPDPALLPNRVLGRMVAQAVAAPATSIGRYGSLVGESALRERIAQRLTLAGARVSPDEIVITNGGCIEALSITLQTLARPGNTVAIESPTFYGMLQALEGLGLNAVELPTDPRNGLDPHTAPAMARDAGAVALVTIPNGHNPLGYRMPDAAKQQLVAECARIDLPIIEDDIYGELAPERQRPAPLKAWDKDGVVLLCSSFSKTLAPGLRVGWVAAGPHTPRVAEIKFRNSGKAATVPQRALAEYLRRGRYERVVREAARQYAARLSSLRTLVAAYFPPETRIARPAAGFTLWVELPGETDATRLYRLALERDIVIAPGELFAPGDRYRHCLRLNAAITGADIKTAVRELGRVAFSIG